MPRDKKKFEPYEERVLRYDGEPGEPWCAFMAAQKADGFELYYANANTRRVVFRRPLRAA